MISESKLAILEKVGSDDVQELVSEVRRLRSDGRVHDAIMSLPYDRLYLHGGRRIAAVDASVLENAIFKAIDGDLSRSGRVEDSLIREVAHLLSNLGGTPDQPVTCASDIKRLQKAWDEYADRAVSQTKEQT